MADRAKLVKVEIAFLGIRAQWEADETERRAAWEIYVELVTRIATQPLDEDEGHLREALSSLHAIFAATRSILRTHGPGVGAQNESVGGIAIAVLNKRLRPFLAKWHPRLAQYERDSASTSVQSASDHAWDKARELRGELAKLQDDLNVYAEALATICDLRR